MLQLPICDVHSLLLNENCAASENYCRATTELMKVVGTRRPGAFAAAKRACVVALGKCTRTKLAITRHRQDHGC